MSSMESPKFNDVQDELEFSKNSPPAQNEEDENLMDPLKTLPEPCTRVIMEYLTTKELLTATEVSKYWKEFIESRSFLMNRAMDRFIVKPTIRDYSLPLIDALFDDGKTKRPYKHMESSLRIVRKFKDNARVIYPIHFFAATLETLTIKNIYNNLIEFLFASEDHSKIIKTTDGCNLPKLQKLIIHNCWNFTLLEDFLFPVLTHLRLEAGCLVTLYDLMKVLFKCPKLKNLYLGSLYPLMPGEPALIDPRQPKIEIISIAHYYPNFMRTQQDSLVKLEVDQIDFDEIAWLLRDLKMLKSLTITVLIIKEEGNRHLTRNESIERLRIRFYRGDLEEIDHQVFYNKLQILFLAIPSLSELTLFSYLDGELLKFLASNMCHLKTLICRGYNRFTEQAAYEEIRNNPHQYVNSSFELVADPNIDVYETLNEF